MNFMPGWQGKRGVRVAPMPGPMLDLDFVNNVGILNGVPSDVASLLTITRASTGWAERSDGTWISFAGGTLRRTDKGVLIEEARTNVALRSQDWTTGTGVWGVAGTVVTPDNAVSPDGTQNADKLMEDATNAEHRIRQNVAISLNQTYTWSVFVKPNGRDVFALRCLDQAATGDGLFAQFTLSTLSAIVANNGNASGGVAAITAYPNGWYRLAVTGKINNTGTTCIFDIFCMQAINVSTYAGDVTKGCWLWQMQAELGASATSVIPTTTAPVTRNADVVSRALSGVGASYSMLGQGVPLAPNPYAGSAETLVQVDANTDAQRWVLRRQVNGLLFCNLTGGTGATFSPAGTWATNNEGTIFGTVAPGDHASS